MPVPTHQRAHPRTPYTSLLVPVAILGEAMLVTVVLGFVVEALASLE